MDYQNSFIELCLEGSSSIFRGINQKDKETLNLKHTINFFRRKQFIFREGEKSHGILFLASGKVKVFKEGVGGRGQIIKLVKQQGFISYKVLFSDNIWPASAVAIDDSAVCTFEKSTIIKILKRNSGISFQFLRLMSDELVTSNNRLVSLTQKHTRGRLAESLLILRDTYGYEADNKTLGVLISREDIANLSSMTTSNAIRTLSNLASDKVIEIRGKRISILDNNQLEHISEIG